LVQGHTLFGNRSKVLTRGFGGAFLGLAIPVLEDVPCPLEIMLCQLRLNGSSSGCRAKVAVGLKGLPYLAA
jgi:hypothetical protein